MILKIRNWEKFQHYKDRRPPWIKLHFSMLSSKDWVMFNDSERVLAVASMLLASQSDLEPGCFEADPEYIKRVAYLNSEPNFKPLIDNGFLEVVQADDSERKHLLAEFRPETEAETETEKKEKNNKKEKSDSQSKARRAIAERVIDYLNEQAGKKFPKVDANLALVSARLKEGYDEQDLERIVRVKCQQWRADGDFNAYLRPATLFGKTKCAQYAGETAEVTKQFKGESLPDDYFTADGGINPKYRD